MSKDFDENNRYIPKYASKPDPKHEARIARMTDDEVISWCRAFVTKKTECSIMTMELWYQQHRYETN